MRVYMIYPGCLIVTHRHDHVRGLSLKGCTGACGWVSATSGQVRPHRREAYGGDQVGVSRQLCIFSIGMNDDINNLDCSIKHIAYLEA